MFLFLCEVVCEVLVFDGEENDFVFCGNCFWLFDCVCMFVDVCVCCVFVWDCVKIECKSVKKLKEL